MTNNNFNIFRVFCALLIFLLPQIHSRVLVPAHATRDLESRTLTIKDETYTLEPLPKQISNGHLYQVVGGWGRNKVPAIAKRFIPENNSEQEIEEEIALTKMVEQYIKNGKVDSTDPDTKVKERWLILKDKRSLKVSGEEMYHLTDIFSQLRKRRDCEYTVRVAPKLVKIAAAEKFTEGVAFQDVNNLMSIVFNRDMTNADFLEMGGATRSEQVLLYQSKKAFLDNVQTSTENAIKNHPLIKELLNRRCTE